MQQKGNRFEDLKFYSFAKQNYLIFKQKATSLVLNKRTKERARLNEVQVIESLIVVACSVGREKIEVS